MIDFVKLHLAAGDGGNGRVSFLRLKYMAKGGPDGGKGGKGGDITIRASKHLATLKQYSGTKQYNAESGAIGGKRNMTGSDGNSLVLEVPLGTEISVLAENATAQKRRKKLGMHRLLSKENIQMETFMLQHEGNGVVPRDPDVLLPVAEDESEAIVITQLQKDGEEIIICQGGIGGRGNETFKGSTRTTPLLAEYGSFGEKREILLELKLLADIGLVGYPNAGKSTIVSSLTGANTKIGAYPFTTLEPHLGMLRSGTSSKTDYELIVADIPGLIEGASEGKGLGHDFLKHVEHCRVLWFVLGVDQTLLFDESVSEEEKAASVWHQYTALQTELSKHKTDLTKKRSIMSLNKIDLYTESLIDAIVSLFKQNDAEIHPISAVTGEHIQELKESVVQLALESEVKN